MRNNYIYGHYIIISLLKQHSGLRLLHSTVYIKMYLFFYDRSHSFYYSYATSNCLTRWYSWVFIVSFRCLISLSCPPLKPCSCVLFCPQAVCVFWCVGETAQWGGFWMPLIPWSWRWELYKLNSWVDSKMWCRLKSVVDVNQAYIFFMYFSAVIYKDCICMWPG